MAVALVDKGEPALAMVHLRHAISLNPENRSTALQDPDLGSLHDLEAFRQIVDIPDSSLSRRVRARQ
jgi:hypothetical protein